MAGRETRVQTAQRVERAVSDAVTRSLWVTSEPGPYRFEGLMGDSLVRDLAVTAGWRQGESREVDAAFDRLRKFERWASDVSFTPQTTSTASQIVPPGYRAVAGLTLGADRPLFAACDHAPIANSAPFDVPRVASSDAVVPATRTEGSQPSGSDPTFGETTVTPIGLSGLVDISRELADSASPAGDLIMLRLLAEDWGRRAEEKIYSELNGNNGQGGTITGGFVPSGAQARTSTTPATNLLIDLKKAVLEYANVRRRKARNIVAGSAALTHLGGLLGAEANTGDDAALASIFGANLNAAVTDYGTASTDGRVLILGADDVFVFTSPVQNFRFDEQSGPALVRIAIWAYFGVAIVRARGISSIRFT